jgi:acyl-CoA synthetase (NDP forming)
MATLLAPRSVALIGVSDDLGKTASRPWRYMRAAGYGGTIYPVARRPIVQGEQAWPDLDALPERPEHAFILLPTDPALAAVADCVRLGIPTVTVLAGGFGEAGPEGAAKEARLRAMVHGSATRLLGPNSLGFVNLHHRLVLTANAAFAEPDLPRGGLFVASQSGSMIGALASRGKARGIGFACLVSVGAETDLGVGEICAAALDDPDVTAFVLFLETIRNAPAIRAFALGAAERGKPVVAFKLGRSAAAAELTQSHTGALAGEDDLADAFLRDCGIARVDTMEGLLEAPVLLRRLPIRPARSAPPVVGVVTTTGGGAAMVVDQLGIRGVDVRGPGPTTVARLAAAGIEAGHGRILDLTLAGVQYAVMRAGLEAMLADPAYDLVLAVVGSSARFQPELAVRPVIDCAADNARLAAFLVPEAMEALGALLHDGVPAFRTPEACGDAIAAAFGRRAPGRSTAPHPMPNGTARLVDELAAYELVRGIGIPTAPAAEWTGTMPAGITAPVAVKILSDAVAHKSDRGGVILNVPGPAAVAGSAAQIRAAFDDPAARIMVQQMERGLGEALIGYRVDPVFGPIILLAAGGTATEVYQDRSVRMAPIDRNTADAMIDEVKGFALLRGFRGRPRGDLDALAEALVALSRLAMQPGVAECEINPLIVRRETEGVVAVDAVAWFREAAS